MKNKFYFPLLATLILVLPARSQVVINEVSYDDAGTDDVEFVELYNAGVAPVVIGGWTLGGFDQAGANTTVTITAGATIAPGGFYVIGNPAVANLNQSVASGFLENDQEAVQLRNPLSALQDEVSYEVNKVLAGIVEGGIWGNSQAAQGPTLQPLVSNARIIDGRDTGVNGRDFTTRRATPGAPNSTGITTPSYSGPSVDALAPGTEVPNLSGSFVNPRVFDPTSTTLIVNGSTYNPSAIPASPQGGNAVMAWDPSGGGNGGGSDFIMGTNSSFRFYVYVDSRNTAAGDQEEWAIGIGGADSLHNLSTNGVNGTSGLAWLFRRDSTGANLKLIDFGAGGPTNSWITLGTIPLTAADLGWHEIGLALNGTNVLGSFDATSIAGTTPTDVVGDLILSYREGMALNANARPLTLDAVPEPSTLLFGCLAAAALFVYRRKK